MTTRYGISWGGLLALGAVLAALGVLGTPGMLGGRAATAALGHLSLPLAVVGGGLVLIAVAALALAPAGQSAAARRDYGSHWTVIGLTILAGLGSVAIVLPALVPSGAGRQPSVVGFLLSAIVLDCVLVGIVYLRVVRPGIITWRDMGLAGARWPRNWRMGMIAAPALFVLAAGLELALKGLGVQQTQLASLEWLRSIPSWQYALVAFSAAVLAPIAEEIYFRGYVFRAYLDQKGPVQAYVFSSLLFAVVHLNLPAMLPIFVVGLFLAFLYHRTGSVLPGMIAHGFNNSVAFAVLYFAL